MPERFDKCSMCGSEKVLFNGNEVGSLRDSYGIKAALCSNCYRHWRFAEPKSFPEQVFIEVLKKKINENRP